QHREKPPSPAKTPADRGDRVELGIRDAVEEHEIGRQRFGLEAVVAKERLADWRLRGRQAEGKVAITLQDETSQARTQHAYAIEDDESLVVGKVRDGRIGAVAVGRTRRQALRCMCPDGHAPDPVCARWRRRWSARTIATMASPTGTARMPTQGS